MKTFLSLFLIALFGLTGPLRAEESPVWIASLHPQATATTDDGRSGPPDLGDREAPTFLRIDLAAKQVTLLAPASRRGEISVMESIQRTSDGWLIRGVEDGRSWTLLIADTGHLTLSAVTDGEVWAVFGETLRVEDLNLPPKSK